MSSAPKNKSKQVKLSDKKSTIIEGNLSQSRLEFYIALYRTSCRVMYMVEHLWRN